MLRYYDKHIDWLHLEIVHGCQLRCVGCPNSTIGPKIAFAPVEQIRTVMRNIDNVRRVHNLRLYNYGEPLLHPELVTVLELTRRQRWRVDTVEISTNGQSSNWDAIEAALRTQVISRLYVSCDGDGTPEDYERLRPPGKWDRLVTFLERVGEMRARVSRGTVLITRSCIESNDARARWRALGEPLGWTPEFRGYLMKPESLLQIRSGTKSRANGLCYWAANKRNLFVDWDGTLLPCCAHPRAAELGSLVERPLSKLVRTFGGERDRFYDDLQNRRAEMKVCGQCDVGPEQLADVKPLAAS